jgi:ribonuclease Z
MKLKPLLVNQEYQDPVLFIDIPQKSEVVLFDLGYCFRLKIKDIKKISRIFISHTHIDHFVGFDHILRLSLDLEKNLEVYGPPGIIRNIEGKLAGYTWNLAEGVNLGYIVFEIHDNFMYRKVFKGTEKFENLSPPEKVSFIEDMVVCRTPEYSVSAACLEHRMPVMAYRLNAVSSVNADIDEIHRMGLTPGKWVGDLKEIVFRDMIEAHPEFEVDGSVFNTGELAERIIRKSPGTSVAYVVDTIYDERTSQVLKDFVKNADYLFCETSYLTSEEHLAQRNYHLTARQAAETARDGNVKVLIPFHFSKRYEGDYQRIYDEACSVFHTVEKAQKYGE